MKLVSPTAILVLLLSVVSVAAQDANNWSGRWETFWRDGQALMALRQDGDVVTGTYEPGGGRIQGRVTGPVLRGTWQQGGASGPIIFALSEDGSSFTGRYVDNEYWNGDRVAADARTDFGHAPAKTPRQALRRLVRLENAATAGDVSATNLAELLLRYDGGAASAREKRRRLRLLWTLIDISTFRIYDAPARVASDTASFKISPAQGIVDYTVRFRKFDGAWFVVVPAETELHGALRRTVEALGYSTLAALNAARANSPRAAMRDFLNGIREWRTGGEERALSTLDLSFVPARLYGFEAPLLAEYLKQVIDRAGYVVWQEVPDDPNRATPYVFYRHPAGSIVIDRVSGSDGKAGTWKFTADTMRSAPDLFAAMQDMPVASEVSPAPPVTRFFQVREKIRSVAPVLLHRVGSLDLWQWLAVPILILLSLGLGWLIALTLSRCLLWVYHGSDPAFGVEMARKFGRPAGALVASGATVISFAWAGLAQTVLGPATLVLAAASAASAAWLFFCVVDVAGGYFQRRAERTRGFVDEIATSLTVGILKVAIVALGIIAIADILGLPYEGIVAGLGVGGIALAFAARDTVTNLIGGAILMSDHPFHRGDLVETEGILAMVEHVGLRSTRLRTLDDSILIIPNSQLTDKSIVNWGQRRKRKTRMEICVTYDTPRNKLDAFVAGLRKVYLAQPTADDTTGYVGLRSLGASSLDIELWGYFNVADYAAQVEAQHRLIGDIVDLARNLGVEFAFPTRTVRIVPDGVADRSNRD